VNSPGAPYRVSGDGAPGDGSSGVCDRRSFSIHETLNRVPVSISAAHEEELDALEAFPAVPGRQQEPRTAPAAQGHVPKRQEIFLDNKLGKSTSAT